MIIIFKLLLFILFPWALFSQTLELTDSMDGITSTQFVEVFEDTTREITIDQIKNKPFKIQKKSITSHGLTTSAWWVRLKVRNSTSHELTWKIKMMFEHFDYVEVWQFSKSSLLNYQLKGDHNINVSDTPYSERAVHSFTTDSASENEIYFKVSFENSGYAELFSTVWSQDFLTSFLQKNINILVAIFAGLLVLLFYNLFILLVLKSKIYFWYILYLFGVILIILTFNQIGAHYIWTNSIFLIDFTPIFSFVITNISFLLFTRAFLETNKRVKRVDTFITVMIVINIVALVLATTDLRIVAMKLIHLSSFTFFFFPFVGAYLWRNGFLIARGYAIASSVLAITVTATLVRALGLIPTNEFLYWLPRLGFILEGVLLAIALADRINIIQTSYTKAQKNLNRSLEEKVRKRTVELEEAKKTAEELARKDALTGVWNRRAFLEMSQLEIDKAHHNNKPLSIIMIDIDKFKEINDNYGHNIGDIVIKSFGENLKIHTRDTDIFARLGGEEFVMVLPFSDIHNAKNKAEFLRAEIEKLSIDVSNKSLYATASFGVAQLKEEESLENLLSRADHAMYFVKKHGRNGVHCDEYTN